MGDVSFVYFTSFEATGLVRHGFSTRNGGVSAGPYASLNLSFSTGDARGDVLENYRRAGAALGVNNMVLAAQTHTTNVRRVGAQDAGKGLVRERDYSDVDALVTDVPGLCLVTHHADCVPVFFLDPVRRAIGLAHAGWKGTLGGTAPGHTPSLEDGDDEQKGAQGGTAQGGRAPGCKEPGRPPVRKGTHVGIVTATLRALEGEFGCRPADMLVGVGPCIGADCYEVGEDVAGLFREAFPTATANGFTNVPHNKTVNGTRNETGGATGMRMGVCCSQRAQEGFQILRDIGGGKSLLDLRGANVLQLLDGGVLPEHITVSGLCPHCHPELFFSHRGMGAVRGGMAAFLGLI